MYEKPAIVVAVTRTGREQEGEGGGDGGRGKEKMRRADGGEERGYGGYGKRMSARKRDRMAAGILNDTHRPRERWTEDSTKEGKRFFLLFSSCNRDTPLIDNVRLEDECTCVFVVYERRRKEE